jgi:hypothetical protein
VKKFNNQPFLVLLVERYHSRRERTLRFVKWEERCNLRHYHSLRGTHLFYTVGVTREHHIVRSELVEDLGGGIFTLWVVTRLPTPNDAGQTKPFFYSLAVILELVKNSNHLLSHIHYIFICMLIYEDWYDWKWQYLTRLNSFQVTSRIGYPIGPVV